MTRPERTSAPRSRGLAAAFAAILALAACGASSGSANRPVQGDPYVVGFEGGLTGTVASYPTSQYDGMKAYFRYLDQRGGVDGHPVNIVARDDTGLDVSKATSNFIEFRDSLKVPVIAGLSVSNVADALAPLADQARIPILAGTGTEATLQHPYAYVMDALFAQEAEAEVNFLKSQLKPGESPRVAVFAPNSAAGKTMEAALVRLSKAAGWNVVVDEFIPVPIPPDAVPQANRVVSAKADYVIGGIYQSLPISFMRALAQAGWKGKFVNGHGASGIAYLQQVNDPNYYVMRTSAFLTDATAGAKVMTENVKATGGDPNGEVLASGWMTAALIAAALKVCGFPCTGPNMKKALDGLGKIGIPQDSAFAPVGFTSSDHVGVHAERVYHFVNGVPAPVGNAVPLTNSVSTPAG